MILDSKMSTSRLCLSQKGYDIWTRDFQNSQSDLFNYIWSRHDIVLCSFNLEK